MADALVDSNFLYALYDQSDPYHDQAVAYLEKNSRISLVIPEVTLPEVVFLFRRNKDFPAAVRFLATLSSSQVPIQCLERVDLVYAKNLMNRYASAELDLVDCCIVALAERLQIPRICTFDRRDFSIIKPTHLDHLELLPSKP